ncbi:MAG: hypothetical protein LUD81_11265 [Clostridiales bacterium]|nr:hypothetical protein [Clostridiales bacterium]
MIKKTVLTLLLILFPICVFGAEVSVTERYMEDTGFYRYYLNSDIYFESAVRLETVVDNIVRVTYNDYVSLTVYKDGRAQTFSSGDYIYGDGEYVIVMRDGDNVGRVSFVLDTVSLESINLDDKFYNYTAFSQSYDTERKMYKESIGSFYSIYTSLPDRGITDKSVKVVYSSDDKAYITVTKDGEEISYSSGKLFTEAGCYSISIIYDTDYAEMAELEGISENDLEALSEEEFNYSDSEDYYSGLDYIAAAAEFKFRIVDTPQNLTNFINPPRDYIISSVMLDGKKIDFDDETMFRAEKDGEYKFIFKNPEGKLPNYSFSYERLKEIPTLKLEGLGPGGISEDRVVIIKNQEYAEVEIHKNGVKFEVLDGVIDEDGLYSIVAGDEAGNVNTYMVNIDIPLRLNLWYLAVFIIAAGAGAGVYIRYIKNNIRIR